jgi:O-antigen/teichoic acid export membrane protein
VSNSITSALGGRAVGRILAAILQGAALLLLFRGLDPSAVGPLFVSFTIGALSAGLAVCGLNAVTLRIDAHGAHVAAGALTWGLRSSALGALFAIPVTIALQVPAQLSVLGALWAYSETASELRVTAWSGQMRFAQGNVVLVARRVTLCMALSAGLAAGEKGVVVALVAHSLLLIAAVAAPQALSSPGARWRDVLGEGRKYWGAGVGSQLLLLDVAVVRSQFGDAVGGGYAAATRLALPLATVASSIVASMVPFLMGEGARTIVRRAYGVAVCSSLIVIATVPAAFYFASPLILGPQYEAFTIVAMAAAAAAGVSLVSQVTLSALIARGGGVAASFALFIGSLCGLASIVLLGDALGVMGIAAGVLLLQVIVLVMLAIADRRTSTAS